MQRKPPQILLDCRSPAPPLELIAWLTWPNNAQRRAKCLSAQAHYQFAALLRNPPLHIDREQVKAFLEKNVIEPTGGWSYDELPAWADEKALIRREMKKALTVGQVLCFLRIMDVHHPDLNPSLNKAAWLVQDWLEGNKAVVSRQTPPIMLWGQRKAIAPLCAATLLAHKEADRAGVDFGAYINDAEHMCLLLSHAKWFREWAISFQAKRSPDVLIPDAVAAVYMADVPAIEPHFAPFSRDELAIARRYKAPNTYHR